MLNPMSLELTKENMQLFFPSWLKPLSNKEITDFLETSIPEETRLWFPEWIKDLPKRVWKTPETKKYNTKKEIKQDIKSLNDQLDWWLDRKHNAISEMDKAYSEIHLEDLLKEKENLNKKLRYTGVKFGNDDLKYAKYKPIENFLTFDRAGFTKCIWHSEKTPSLHKITGINRVYCFGCHKNASVIDVVMEIHQCKLPEALKIILK